MTKVIDVFDEDEGDGDAFERFCELYDIPVMDRLELLKIFEESGKGYALRRWNQMQAECCSDSFDED